MTVTPTYKIGILRFITSVTIKLRAKITKIIQNRTIDNKYKIKTFCSPLHKNLDKVEHQQYTFYKHL